MSYNSITNMSLSVGDIISKAERYIAIERGSSIEPSFSIQENVGVYSRGLNLLSLAVDGATPLEISKTQVTAINGTQAQPAYSFTTDPDTGMFLSSYGVLSNSVGGAKVMSQTSSFTQLYTPLILNGDLLADNGFLIRTNNAMRLGFDSTGTTSYMPIRNQSGTLAQPAYSFSADSDTGLYNEADGKMSVSCNGTKVMSMSPTLIEFFAGVSLPGLFTDGTVAAPSISFTSDPDTGFYHKTYGTVGYVADGKEAVTFDTIGIELQDGSFGNPSLSFMSNSSIGLYKTGTYLGISEYGSQVAEFSHSDIKLYSPVRSTNGSATAPSYSFSTNPNTGMYNNLGQLSFSQGGTNLITLSNPVVQVNALVRCPDSANKYAPPYSFQTNTQSGMYLGSDFVGISYNSNDTFLVYPTETTTKGRSRADSFYFRLDPTTGISNDYPSEFYFYGGGAVKAAIQSDGFIRASGGFRGFDGNVYAPAYTFNSNGGTGMFLGPGYLGFSYNGDLKFDVTDSGTYAIGYSRADSFDFRTETQSGMYLNYVPLNSDVRIRMSGTDCASFKNGKIIAFKNNSVSVPTISWNHDTTTGFNSWIAGGINFISSGTERAQLGNSYFIPAYTNGISCGLPGYAWAACYSFAYASPSDQRLKSDIADCDLGLDFINAIRPVQYRWNDRVRTHRGFISQEIKSVCDQLNISGENCNNIGFWNDNSINTPERSPVLPSNTHQSIAYTEFIPILTKAIQELTRRVEVVENNLFHLI